uniref:Uncharacterized protein n=1 Tax=Oryza rufipogon TaxID=4529 RepID=A0A0E0Q121_ORYRU
MKSIKESSNQEVRKVLTYGFHDSKSFKTCQAGDSSRWKPLLRSRCSS